MNGVWLCLQALASTFPTAPRLSSTKVRLRSLHQCRYRCDYNCPIFCQKAIDSSQVGRAVAALLSLPITSEGSNQEACLDNFKNKVVYVSSFTISQKDMLKSALRVTGTTEDEWTIVKEPVHERFSSGLKEIKEGKHTGFPKMISRVFYPDGSGDVEHNKGTLNSLLNLPREDIDEATKAAIDRSRAFD